MAPSLESAQDFRPPETADLVSLVARHVRQVRRRLWLGELLRGLLISWAGAFVAAMIYFVISSAIQGSASASHGWIVLGLAMGSGTLVGAFWAWTRAPGTIDSALALDRTCALQERVTTFLGLTAAQTQSPAGQALLQDVHEKLTGLNVRARFPIRLNWPHFAMPVTAACLAVLAFFFSPQINFSFANGKDKPSDTLLANAEEAKRQLDSLKKDFAKDRKDQPLSKEEKDLEDKLNKLLEKDLDPQNEKQLRETLEAVRNVEDKMKDRINEFKDQARKNKEVLNAFEKLDKFNDLKKDIVGREFEQALAKGDMKKAMAEIDKLQKKLQNNELGKEDKERLAQRLHDLQRELQRLRDHQDLRDKLAEQLQKEVDAGNLTPEEKKALEDELARELDGLKEDLADLKDLADLLEDLELGLLDMPGDLKECLGKLAKIKGKLAKLGKLDGDAEAMMLLKAEQARLEAARLAMLRAMPGGPPNPAAGPRPNGAEHSKDFDTINDRVQQEADYKKARITGYSRGGTFTKIPAQDVTRTFEQAQQEASEALDRQRIPADAADILKGYLQRLGGQK